MTPSAFATSPPFDTFVLFIFGFRQSARRYNGLLGEYLWALKERRRLGVSTCRIEAREWDADWATVADYIGWVLRPSGSVYVVAYSWGQGWGFARGLAPALAKRGVDVAENLSLDGVYRSSLFPKSLTLNPLSLYNGPGAPRIRLPHNVREVRVLRQSVERPMGHQITAINPEATRIHPTVWVRLGHSEMDDSEVFRQESRALVRRALRKDPQIGTAA